MNEEERSAGEPPSPERVGPEGGEAENGATVAEKAGSAPTQGRYSKVMDALVEVEANPKPFKSLTLFIVTLAMFFTGGIVHSDLNEILVLIAVLLFHELGHLAAMKLLGYRDVKMFFIPFLGAAVSGKARNSSAVRSCFVSIMGPLPGVAASLVLLALYAKTHYYYLYKAAQIMLLLNVFNLLPIMPLDGGRFVDVLFIRQRFFRLAFALFGVGCFVALAISGGDLFLGLIAFFSLIGAVAGFRTNRVARQMLDEGMREKTFAELADNPPMFARLLANLESAFPKAFTPQANARNIHAHVINVIDTVKFVPARWFSRILLSGAYGGILLASLAIAFYFLAADYHEKLKPTADASIVLETWQFNQKIQETQLDKGLRFNGLQRRFGADTSIVTGWMEYRDGFRNGRMVEFSRGTDTSEVVYYTMGRIDSIAEYHGGERKIVIPGERSAWDRAQSWVIRKSQPRLSNHKHFDR
jgi:Zn-dependent protease